MSSLRAFLVTCTALCSACGDDPSLQVVVEHPDDFAIERTVVSVYESSSLRCMDIAIARIGTTELGAALVAEQTITPAGVDGALSGLSRTDTKLVVARGYDAAGIWVTAGCEQVDVVEGRREVVVRTVSTVNAAVIAEPASDTDPQRVRLSTIDTLGNAVAGRRTGWTVFGPFGAEAMYPANVTPIGDGEWQPLQPSCTGDDGTVVLHPTPPGTVGGYQVQLHAEWAVQPPSPYTRLAATFAPRLLTVPASSLDLCAVRRSAATTRLVCLDGNVARDLELVVGSDGAATLVERASRPVLDPLAVISMPRTAAGAERDVYLITTTGEYRPLFGAPDPVTTTPCTACSAPGVVVTDVLAIPPCGQTRGKVVMRLSTTGPGQVKLMNADGTGFQDVPTPAIGVQEVALDNAGCVTRLQPSAGTEATRQVFSYHVGVRTLGELVLTATRAVYSCTLSECAGNDLLTGAGVGFAPGPSGESLMLTTSVDASGVVVSHVVLAAFTSMRDRFIERDRYAAAGIPSRLVGGQFDGDGLSDLFWSLEVRRASTSFQVAYARRIGTEPLAAVSPTVPVDVGSLVAADLDSDGRDELIVVGDFTPGGAGVLVIPMAQSAAKVPVPVDPACAP